MGELNDLRLFQWLYEQDSKHNPDEAVQQGDAADEVRAGREPRPSQLIPSVGRTMAR